ncbi:MAG: glycosyltransferase family 4 protein [Candidatus Niyogibacteria bacterium]|nr:MAG: glycosyltransferase family 4 protein [Candidatus Niyogibacteria bacterium]
MKILISTPLFPPDIGGPATYSKVLAEEFPKYGVNVEVLSFGGVRHLPKIIRHAVYFCRVFWRARKADIIFAQDPVSVGFPSALASMILRKPFILKVVGDYAWEQGVNRFGVKELLDEFLNTPHGWRIEFLRRVERFVANRARAVIVPSRYLKSVVEKWGIESGKIKVIYNSVQLRYIEVEKEKVRKESDLAGKILVSVGRLVPWKGFEMLIGIMPEISKKYPDTKLLIIGSGPEESALKAKSYQLKANVQFLGNLPHEQVLKYLRAADIFLLNTGYEGFSHQILEAMVVGAPIISTHSGGNREILKDRENSIVVGYNDKEAWVRAIFELFENSSLYSGILQNSKIDIARFSGQNMIEETLKVLKYIPNSRE